MASCLSGRFCRSLCSGVASPLLRLSFPPLHLSVSPFWFRCVPSLSVPLVVSLYLSPFIPPFGSVGDGWLRGCFSRGAFRVLCGVFVGLSVVVLPFFGLFFG